MTRQEVLATARALNHRPNLTPRIQRTQITRTLGFLSEDVVTDANVGGLIHGSLLQAAADHHRLIIVETTGDPKALEQVVEDLLDRQVDGFIYATSWTKAVEVPPALSGQRVVLLNCVAQAPVTSVVPDDSGAGRAAVKALLKAGHSHGIVLVGETPADVVAAAQRSKGIAAALSESGYRLAAAVDTVWQPGPSFEATRAFLAEGPDITAMVCLNDRVALGVYQALAEAGLRVPHDVSVVSFDDSSLASWLRPGLTSVAPPYEEMGIRAVEGVLDAYMPPREITVSAAVRHRGSVGRSPRPALRRSHSS